MHVEKSLLNTNLGKLNNPTCSIPLKSFFYIVLYSFQAYALRPYQQQVFLKVFRAKFERKSSVLALESIRASDYLIPNISRDSSSSSIERKIFEGFAHHVFRTFLKICLLHSNINHIRDISAVYTRKSRVDYHYIVSLKSFQKQSFFYL